MVETKLNHELVEIIGCIHEFYLSLLENDIQSVLNMPTWYCRYVNGFNLFYDLNQLCQFLLLGYFLRLCDHHLGK